MKTNYAVISLDEFAWAFIKIVNDEILIHRYINILKLYIDSNCFFLRVTAALPHWSIAVLPSTDRESQMVQGCSFDTVQWFASCVQSESNGGLLTKDYVVTFFAMTDMIRWPKRGTSLGSWDAAVWSRNAKKCIREQCDPVRNFKGLSDPQTEFWRVRGKIMIVRVHRT